MTGIQVERQYDASVEKLWRLWTTKEGFEAWWGPEGYRTEVHMFDFRVGGELFYTLITEAPDQVEYMKKAGRPLSHEARGTFKEITPLKRLMISHNIDFLPGVKPYENRILVEFFPKGKSVRMVITEDAFHTEEMTRLSRMGLESQLKKVPAALS
jgi:uncharacterized protein YndB with AHSA1/START domain